MSMSDGEFNLLVQDESGNNHQVIVRRSDMKTISNLRAAIMSNNMTRAKEFNIGYEHPTFSVFTVVCGPWSQALFWLVFFPSMLIFSLYFVP
jgi:hypothetical protein